MDVQHLQENNRIDKNFKNPDELRYSLNLLAEQL